MAIQVATANFTAEETKAVTWPAMSGNFGIAFGETVSDALGGTDFWTTNRTSTGCTVNAGAPITGFADLIIYDKP